MKRAGTFFAKANATRGEMFVYDEISTWGINANSFNKELRALGAVTDLDIYINSPGGGVFDGIAIYNQIVRHPAKNKTMHVDGIAASIASVIIMAGTKIKMSSNCTVMIHDPWCFAGGTAKDLRKTAESLELTREQLLDTYVKRTGGDREEVSNWMTEETWMTATQAKERGFADEITGSVEMEASFPLLEKFAKLPSNLRQDLTNVSARMARMNMVATKIRGASPAKA